MSGSKLSPGATELISQIINLDGQGLLSEDTVRRIKQSLQRVSLNTREEVANLIESNRQQGDAIESNWKEWEVIGVSERFYSFLSRDEWKTFTILARNNDQTISDVEIAEKYFEIGEPTESQVQIIRSHLMKISSVVSTLNEGKTNPGNKRYRGKLVRCYQWKR